MPKVSVIVPIYNVEKYIERCVRSLMEQNMNDLEFILVNDASTDCSMDIVSRTIEEYPLRKPLIKIINQEHNQGVAAARTIGMKVATGEYQIHCDPDDWVELEYIESLYKECKTEEADIALGGYINEYENKETSVFVPRDYFTGNSEEALARIFNQTQIPVCAMKFYHRRIWQNMTLS